MLTWLIDTAIETAELAAVICVIAAVALVAVGPRRGLRVMHAAIDVTRTHAPRWLAWVLSAALAIPGPVDELIVAAIIAVMAWRRPVMRAAMVAAVRDAWHGIETLAPVHTDERVNVVTTVMRRPAFGGAR
jgi:hypothetical protein